MIFFYHYLNVKITILTQILSRVNQTGSTRHCFVYISKQDGDIKCPKNCSDTSNPKQYFKTHCSLRQHWRTPFQEICASLSVAHAQSVLYILPIRTSSSDFKQYVVILNHTTKSLCITLICVLPRRNTSTEHHKLWFRHLHLKITILTQILSRVNQTGSIRHCFV
jgi:hypothetical protein